MKRSIALTSILLASACANIVSGTSQDILIQTPNVTDAQCTIHDQLYHRWVISPPESIQAAKGGGTLEITCTKEGYRTLTAQQTESLDPYTLGNVLMGPIGLYGFFEDGFSGAIEEYPDTLSLTMQPIDG